MKTSKTLRDDLQKLAVYDIHFIPGSGVQINKVGENLYEAEDSEAIYPAESLDEVLWTVENLL